LVIILARIERRGSAASAAVSSSTAPGAGHRRRVPRAGDRKSRRRQRGGDPRQRVVVAGDDPFVGRVVRGDHDRAGADRDRARARIGIAAQRDHAARSAGSFARHEPSAQRGDRDGVGRGDRAGGRPRRQLAERMTEHDRRSQVEHAMNAEAHRDERRLQDLRTRELAPAARQQPRDVGRRRLRRVRDQRRDCRLGEHVRRDPRRIDALPRKQQRGRHSDNPPSTTIAWPTM
jgi:hypothetical protein